MNSVRLTPLDIRDYYRPAPLLKRISDFDLGLYLGGGVGVVAMLAASITMVLLYG